MNEPLYELITTAFGEAIIKRIADGACVPQDAGNVDYQLYLKWVNDNA